MSNTLRNIGLWHNADFEKSMAESRAKVHEAMLAQAERSTTISLDDARQLEKRLGAWIWDGLLFNRDGILNPQLIILPNESGTRIRRFLTEMGDDWRNG